MSGGDGAVRFGVLGEVQAQVAGREVDLGGLQPRAVVAALVVADGRTVSADALLEAVWGDDLPPSATGTLQAYVSRLRKALGPQAAAVLERRGRGYRLAVAHDALDWARFESLADEGRRALTSGRAEDARRLLLEAEALWRGPALAGLRDRPFAVGWVARLEERRESARGDRLEAELRLGRHASVLGELEEAVRARPLDESRWFRLALARYRSGQQDEALKAVADARRALVEELGAEPRAALRELEVQLLQQHPSLDLVPEPAPATARHVVPAPEPTAAGVRARGEAGRLVWRDAELAALLSALDDSAVLAQVGVVEGEAGIGKTRLLEELGAVAARRGALVVWGRSHESGAAPAFWPWLPVLRALREADEDAFEPALASLLAARGETHPTALFEVFDAVQSALRRTSRRQHVVVVLDDLQWADTASLELLAHLAAHLADDPVLLLATVRDAATEPRPDLVALLATVARRRGSRRLQLRGLPPTATAELVRSTADREVEDAVVRAVHERAAGNPFFATELARLLVDGDALGTAGVVPASIRDVVRRRLAGVPSETTALLQLCAVAGREVDLLLLADVTGQALPALVPLLEPALQHGLLTEAADGSGELRFVHALVREVLADDLSVLGRRRLHLQIADALQGRGDDQAELLAEHLWAAVPLADGARVAQALEVAAEVALRRFALQSADDLLTRAVELRRQQGTSDEHQLAELHALVRLTSARRAMRGFGGVADLLQRGEQLARRLGCGDVERELAWATWAMADTACDFDRALPIAERFSRLLDDDDPALRAFGAQVWGIQCWHQGRILESREHLDLASRWTAEAGARPVGPTLLSFAGERTLLLTAFRLAVHELTEHDPSAPAALDELAAQLDPFGVAMLATFACHAPGVRGDVDRVLRAAEPVVASDGDGLMSFWGSQARMHLGWARMCHGALDEGLALWEEGRKTYTGSGLHTGLGLFLANAALALLHAGRLEQAADLAGQAREELEVYREMWPEPLVLLVEAELAAAGGADPAALLEAALHAAERRSMLGAARRVRAAAARLGL